MSSRLPLLSGGFFDFEKPEDSIYTIEDIATGLSLSYRFAGHTKNLITVAQHVVILSHEVTDDDALAALMHDSFEAFGSDIVRSLKSLLPDYRHYEDKALKDILFRVGVEWPLSNQIKLEDKALGDKESDLCKGKHDFFPESWRRYESSCCRFFWTPSEAKELFLHRWSELTGLPRNYILLRY